MLDRISKIFTPANIILIGGLVTLVLTYLATKLTERENKEDQKKLKDELIAQSRQYAEKVGQYAQTQKDNDEEIKSLQNQLIIEYRKQVNKSEELATTYKRLAESQEKVTALTKETQIYMTGGEGYCYVNIYPNSPNDLKAEVDIASENKYPLYDIEIDVRPWLPIQDFSLTEEAIVYFKNEMNLSQNQHFNVGTLASQKSQLVTSKQLGNVPFDKTRTWFYTVDFTARNGEWRQVWELSIDKNSKLISSHVIYKIVIENNTFKRVVLKKFIHPSMSHSIINHLILEENPYKFLND